ncbi:MAG: 2-oxoacid:acceptor oxidoreductase subunit alpha [Conexivisphaerales archaeon]
MDLIWTTGGPQGSGIDTAAHIFTRAVAKAGYYVYGGREYFSNIKGRHSYLTMRISDVPVYSIMEKKDILVSYDAETVFSHFLDIADTGVLIYNVDESDFKLSNIPSMVDPLKMRIANSLGKASSDITVKVVVDYLNSRGVTSFGYSANDAVRELGRRLNESQLGKIRIMINTMAISLSTSVLKIEKELILEAIEDTFGTRSLAENQQAVNLSYEIASNWTWRGITLKRMPVNGHRVLIDGPTSIALGKLSGGLTFQSYYPISPATDESVYLEGHPTFGRGNSVEGNVVVVQTEDEISAIAMANGASLTGARSATATSGPGFDLMTEGIGYAGMVEIPVVITDYMRGGPSTGLPTRNAQADLLQAVYGGHGEFPRIVLASGDHVEAFYDAANAFNYAERYQLPVIHLVDKSIMSSYAVIDETLIDNKKLQINRGKIAVEKEDNYKRFKLTEDGVSPRSFLGSPNRFWLTGDEHNEQGHISDDAVMRTEMYLKRMKKIELAESEIPESEKYITYGSGSSSKIVVGWGSTKWPIIESINRLQREGSEMGFIYFKMFSPFPKGVKRLLEGKEIINIESNYLGQLGTLLGNEISATPSYSALKVNGRMVSSSEVYTAIKQIIENGERKVIMNGTA